MTAETEQENNPGIPLVNYVRFVNTVYVNASWSLPLNILKDIQKSELLVYSVDHELDILQPRERQILELRHGLTDKGMLSLEKTSELILRLDGANKVTRSRVAQIQIRAERKLRRHDRSTNEIRQFLTKNT